MLYLNCKAADSTSSSSSTNTSVLSKEEGVPRLEFPFLTLLASGGHTSLLLSKGLGDHVVLGGTLDDSLGEALDKAARVLGLDCTNRSGGVALEIAAAKAVSSSTSGDLEVPIKLTVPMRDKANCDFSYSGNPKHLPDE